MDFALARRLSRYQARALPALLDLLCYPVSIQQMEGYHVRSTAASAIARMDVPMMLPQLLEQYARHSNRETPCAETDALNRLIKPDSISLREEPVTGVDSDWKALTHLIVCDPESL
ncbi:MAG: hypothetical protein AAGG11_24180, partial [Pseudomonadota bacterium]